MEELRREEKASGGTGRCRCTDWQTGHLPGDDTFKRLLKALEQELEDYADRPTDATKKFGDDLKDYDKEYQGIADVVDKYEDFYAKLECKLAEARTWKEKIEDWSSELKDGRERDEEKKITTAIRRHREKYYDAVGKKICCEWIALREKLIKMGDCLAQAVKEEEEVREDYGALKGLEKNLNDRFAELKSLFEKAEALHKQKKLKSVFAVRLEYEEVYDNLGTVRTWDYWKKLCQVKEYGGRDETDEGSAESDEEAKLVWPPEKFKKELTRALRSLIMAGYQRFRWQQQRLETEMDGKKSKEACEKFRKSRRDEFIQEAEDIEATVSPDTGTGTE